MEPDVEWCREPLDGNSHQLDHASLFSCKLAKGRKKRKKKKSVTFLYKRKYTQCYLENDKKIMYECMNLCVCIYVHVCIN